METVVSRPAQLSPTEHRLLEMGRIEVHELQNAAFGTFAGSVHSLARRGLMRAGPLSAKRGVYTYDVTREGRAAYLSYSGPYVPTSR